MQQEIIKTARGWLGVPFHHQGRSRSGIDCLGLLMVVAAELHLYSKEGLPITAYDTLDYSKSPNPQHLCDGLQRAMDTVPIPQMQQGDIVLCQIDNTAQHLGIIGDYPHGGFSLIHAYAPARKVVEHPLDASWQQRIVQVFRLKLPEKGNA